MVKPQDIEALAARLIQVTGALKQVEPLIKQTRAVAREELQAELEPYTTRQAELEAERAKLVEILLPAWAEMYELHKVKRFAGIEYRRGRSYKATLPPEETAEYKAIAEALLHDEANGEPVVTLRINKRALDNWIKINGLRAAAELGIDVAASDTLAVINVTEGLDG